MPSWAEDAAHILREQGHTPKVYTDRTGYVARLADDHAAMVLVGDGEGWRFWVVTPKTSPATRRIPVVMVTDDADIRDAALRGGANLVVPFDEFLIELPMLLEDLARVPNPAVMAALEEQCHEPLPPEAVEAVNKFNSGEYYKQHDLFEALWMHDDRPIRDLYRAVLQVGIGYFQATRGNQRGALKMLLRSIQWLALLPDVCQGIDIATLRADAARVRAELERVGPDGMAEFDVTLLKPVRRIEENEI
jgi:predicted metal-dependent hydrolase